MTPRILAIFTLILSLCTAAYATGEKGSDAAAPKPILEISPMSLTLDAGGGVEESYTITGSTTAKLDGLAVQPSDLLAGMTASLALAPDGKTVISIMAHKAPRDMKKEHHDQDNINLNVGLHK